MKNGKIKQKTTNECEICIKMSDKLRIDFKEKAKNVWKLKKKPTKISQKATAAKSVLESEYDEAVKNTKNKVEYQCSTLGEKNEKIPLKLLLTYTTHKYYNVGPTQNCPPKLAPSPPTLAHPIYTKKCCTSLVSTMQNTVH